MKAKIYTVNGKGLDEIHQFLAEHHKDGLSFANKASLYAYALEAESHIDDKNPAFIELKSWETLSGHTETFDLSRECIDVEEVDI